MFLFTPDFGAYQLNYVIDVFRASAARYYPGHPFIAFIVLFLMPLVVFVIVSVWIGTELLTALFKNKATAAMLKKVIALKPMAFALKAAKGFVYFDGKNFDWFLLRQILFSVVLVSIFAGVYYASGVNSISDPILFSRQLLLSKFLLFCMALHLFVVLAANNAKAKEGFWAFVSEPVSPYVLAGLRIGICFFLLEQYIGEYMLNSYWASLPHEARVSLPMAGWLIQNVPVSPAIYNAFCISGIVLAIMGMLGLFTNVALLINIAVSIYVIGVPLFFGKLFHVHIWVWFPAILAFSRCGQVLSLDYVIKKYLRRQSVSTEPSSIFGLPIKVMLLQFGIIYFFAGFMKLYQCGLAWALSESMVNQLRMEWVQHYNRVPGIRLDLYPVFAYVAGLGVILFELYFPFLLFSKVGRWVCFIGGLAMHKVINYFMYIGFEDLQRLYIVFPDWQKLINWVKKKTSGPTIEPVNNPPFGVAWRLPGFKRVAIVGGIILCINFTFSVFGVHSWPFSSYPTYSAIVKPYTENIYFQAFDSTGNIRDVYTEGRAANFRMESYTPLEDEIIRSYKLGDKARARGKLDELWFVWASNVPALRNVDSLAVYIQKSPINPDSVKYVYKRDYILSKKL